MTGTSDIKWREWGKESFAEARKGDKPILLRLSAVWCHWCHVMDSTSDKDPRAIQLLNEKFVPIRVDIDRMPDVRERYNFGGYPTSAFLTPDGDILTGGTYIPPDQFVQLLEAVDKAYKERKDEILKQIADHHAHHKPAVVAAEAADARKTADDLYEDTLAALLGLFDAERGGFGSQPKFPHGAATELALLAHLDQGRGEYETVARRTLDAMRNSALWDREELGFFRYSVTPDWSEPHYEKMLETNAALLSCYAVGARVLQRGEDHQTLDATRRYLETVLRDPKTGLFYGSQDADEKYYGLPLAQRRTQKAPYVDTTHYIDWNGQMVSAWCEAYRATGDPTWIHEAQRTLDSMLDAAWRDAKGMQHYVREGKAHRGGLFSDQVYTARALLDVSELSGNDDLVGRAVKLVEFAKKMMWDAKRNVFNDKAVSDEDLGLLRHTQASIVDNGAMAQVLVRLAALRPEAGFETDFENVLKGHKGAGEKYGIFASELALACLDWLRPGLDVHITAPVAQAKAAVQEAGKIKSPTVRIHRTDKASEVAKRLGMGSPPLGSVFFCSRTSCSRLYKVGEPFARDAEKMLAMVKTA